MTVHCSRSVEQIVDIPVPGGSLQDLSFRSAAVLPEELDQGFFRNFPRPQKSTKVARQVSARVHAHSSSSTEACEENGVRTSENTFVDDLGQSWLRGTRRFGPFLGAPADSGAGERYWSPRVSLWCSVLSESGSVRILTGVHSFQTFHSWC